MSGVLGNGSPATDSSGADADVKARKRGRLRTAHKLRRLNTLLFGDQRLGRCGFRAGTTPGLKRTVLDGDGRVTWTGVATCGSVHACLSCAAKIRAVRAAEIDHLAKSHLAAGGGCTMVTFTLPHLATDDLGELWEAMGRAWRSMVQGRQWQAVKADVGIVGMIRATEVTHGRSGWHPHLHVLVFHDRPVSEDDGSLSALRTRFSTRWGRFIERHLGRSIHGIYGVDATPVRDDVGIGEYVSKVHFELARPDLKTGSEVAGLRSSRTPWQIGVDAAETGEVRDVERWREYVRVSFGRRALGVSPALRERYGTLGTEEQTDEELAQQEQEGELVVTFDPEVYDSFRREREPITADICIAYEDGGMKALLALLAARGYIDVMQVLDPDGAVRIRRLSSKARALVATIHGSDDG